MLTKLAIEAGADPQRAKERMAQAAQVLASYALPPLPAPKRRRRPQATPRNPTQKRD